MFRCQRPRYPLTLSLAALVGLTGVAPGTATAARVAAQRPPAKPPAKAPAPAKPAPPREGKEWFDTMTPLDSGPGVLVAEPVAVDAGEALANFGSGCARWLHLIVGGHGELGKTPPWSEQQAGLDKLDRKDLRLAETDLTTLSQRLAISLGITHVALGEIRGSTESCTLSYRLWSLADRKAVGEALTASGSATEVVAALPKLATGLCQGLGIAAPRVPAALGESVEDLQFLGSIRRVPKVSNRNFEPPRLNTLAQRVFDKGDDGKAPPTVLAAFLNMMYQTTRGDANQVISLGQGLVRALPENALFCAEAVSDAYDSHRSGMLDLPVKEVQENLRRFPNNYALRFAQYAMQYLDGKKDEARQSYELAVRCVTRNPSAWQLLGEIISMQANDVRKARITRAMSEQERAFCNARYEEWLPVVLKVTQLDTQESSAWLNLAVAATFVGEQALADRAFWKAIDLAKGNPDIYDWGFEMYQPKWGGDPEKLAKVARLTETAAPGWNSRTRVNLAFHAYTAGHPEVGDTILKTDAERSALKEGIDRYEKAVRGDK